jgi:NADPH:quinone reductase-like Zn-dependent oxidoreductase
MTRFVMAIQKAAEAGAMHSNHAAWLPAKHGTLKTRPAPYTSPRADEIVVCNGAVGINPVDWMTLPLGDIFYPWLKYPAILGTDVAGVVVEVGSGVRRFKIGDRVFGHAVGAEKARNRSQEGAFQLYTVLLERMTSKVPDAISFERAAVLPLGLSTASCAMFQNDYLALQYPAAKATPTGKTLLIWGGSTSVGSNAIQLAVAAGYEVITTASPKNFAYVQGLGASLAFDYRSKTAVADIIKAFKGRSIAGALAIGVGSAAACVQIVAASKGRKFVAMATPAVSFVRAPSGFGRIFWLVPTMTRMIAATSTTMIQARLQNIGAKFVWGGALVDNEICRIIYQDFIAQALTDGRFVPAPAPRVVGHGLDRISAALGIQRSGVSAQKIVVTL